jgi:GNAT superfamily N-acetyltransferase
VHIAPVTDLAALTAWQAVEATCLDHDVVALPADPLEERLLLLDPDRPDAGERTLLRLGTVDGEPVGAVQLDLPTLDNLTSATVSVWVLPQHRRRGYGRRLLTAALDELTELGRTRCFFEVPSPYPTGMAMGEPLLQEIGARPVLKEVRRLLDLSEPAPPTPNTPGGYRLVQWVDRLPDEHVDALAYLMHRMSTDAPLEDMDWEPEVWDAARYREKEAAAIARGRIRVGTLAVEEASGQVVGFTDLGVSSYAPVVGYQWETLVLPEHRGHGLGYVLKAHNHGLLRKRSPSTRWVNTWNAESNRHMVAINERLGFRPVTYETAWQLDR